jgi:hypothetical protein
MEGDLDTFDFILAEALGKSLAEIGDLSNDEVVRWQAFYTYRTAMRELEAK